MRKQWRPPPSRHPIRLRFSAATKTRRAGSMSPRAPRRDKRGIDGFRGEGAAQPILRPVAQMLDLVRPIDGAVLHFDRGLGPVLGRQALPGNDGLLEILKAHPSAGMFQRRRLPRFPVNPALTAHVAYP